MSEEQREHVINMSLAVKIAHDSVISGQARCMERGGSPEDLFVGLSVAVGMMMRALGLPPTAEPNTEFIRRGYLYGHSRDMKDLTRGGPGVH